MTETAYLIIYVVLSVIIFTTLGVCTWEYIELRIRKNKPVDHKTIDWFMSGWDKTATLFHKTKVGKVDANVIYLWDFPESIKKGAIRLILGWILIITTLSGGFILLESILANYQHNSIPRLILELEYENRRGAIDRLAYYAAVEPMVTAYHSTSNLYMQSGILEALSQIDNGYAAGALIEVLNDKDPAIRTSAVIALAQIVIMNVEERALIVEPLIAALEDPIPAVRERAALGLGYIGDKRSVEPLIALLKDTDQSVRINATQSLVKIDDERAEEPLMAAFERNDLAIIAKESAFFIERAKTGTEPIFIVALNSFGTKETANYYLNCGNMELENAAREWAKLNGYEIGKTSNTSDIVNWGGN